VKLGAKILSEDQEIEIFKVLSHPLRRKILRLIASRGAVSYKELAKLEPKAGVLYHHLRLLGDLITQDSDKRYVLTEKGERAYEILTSIFIEPSERSIHRILTPRWAFELIEGRIAVLTVAIFLLSTLLWWGSNAIPILITVIPDYGHIHMPPIVFPVINWLGSSLVSCILIRLGAGRRADARNMLLKSTPSLTLINLYPLISRILTNFILRIILLAVLQFFAILFLISAISVVARISIRVASLITIVLHYLSIVSALAIIYLI